MFYTIISKLPFISSDKSSRKFFKIFVFGSLLYILLHYYLFANAQEGILDMVKTYIYYAMVADLVTAYALETWFSGKQESNESNESNELENSNNSNNVNNVNNVNNANNANNNHPCTKYTPQQQAELDRRYTEFKHAQALAMEANKQKALKTEDTTFIKKDSSKQKNNKSDKSDKSDKNVEDVEDFENDADENFDDEPSLPKARGKKTHVSEKSSQKSDSRKQKLEDTDLPRFNRNK
jgi:hypothetical protein